MSPNVKTTSNWIITSWFMTREEIEKRMDELARKYVETRDPEIIEELYKLRLERNRVEKES
jgi:FKBP-type peptidyl-prolyl cis-trans isomerase (trigger factor)